MGFDGRVVENSPFPPVAYVRIPDVKLNSFSMFHPLPIDDIVGSPGSILGTGIIFVLLGEGWEWGCAAPHLHVNEPKKTGTRSARTPDAAKTPSSV